ncbi:MAG: hypothetical protein AB7O49_06930 [Sphingomonadales bacterium]
MVEGYNFQQLKHHILPLSSATTWEVAVKEWGLVGIHEADEPESCPCGHFPIIEICSIHNRVTGHSTDVGNVCVKRFLGLRSDLIFSAIKRIRQDVDKSLNADAITFFYERGLLNAWEYEFCQNTMRLRKLSSARLAKRRGINQKVLAVIKRRGFKGPE